MSREASGRVAQAAVIRAGIMTSGARKERISVSIVKGQLSRTHEPHIWLQRLRDVGLKRCYRDFSFGPVESAACPNLKLHRRKADRRLPVRPPCWPSAGWGSAP